MEIYDVIVIGSGPAGLTAALYATRANLKTLVIAGRKWGGQLQLTTLVENYPGFPEGIQGPDLMTAMRKQAEHHGAQILDVDFKSADYNSKPMKVMTEDGKEYPAKSVIIATGAETRWLEVPGEKEKIGRGVSSCAPCDAPFFRNKNAIVVGGGDSAMEEAQVLAKFVNHVWVVHRRDKFRASDIMQKRTFDNPKITVIWNTEVVEIMGEMKVEKVKFKTQTQDKTIPIRTNNQEQKVDTKTAGGVEVSSDSSSVTWEFPTEGIFVAIGHIPNSALFEGIDRDEKGFIKVYNHTKTNVDGVYVAGDVHDATYKQAVTAAGFGCMAALEVEKYLMN